MSRNDFVLALTLYAKGFTLRTLLMASMLTAEEDIFQEDILGKLRQAFPEIWDELDLRRNSPTGLLDSDDDS